MAVELRYDAPPSALSYMARGALPAERRFDLAPRIAARWTGHRADPRRLRAFLELTATRAADHLPLLYPHTFGFRLSMALLTHPSFPVPIWSVLQVRNHLVQHSPIALDARMDLDVVVCAGRLVKSGAELDLHTSVHVEGALAWESVVTFLARGRFGAPGAPSPLVPAPSELGPPLARWTTPRGGHLRFAALTGDYNGIHQWGWYARRFGFERALYHPQRVLGWCLARLDAVAAGEPQRLDAWLKGPVPRGASVCMTARPIEGGTTFGLFVEGAQGAAERPSIVGRAGRLEHSEERPWDSPG